MQRRTDDLRPRRDGFDLFFLAIGFSIVAAFAIGIVSMVSTASDPAWSRQGGIMV